MNFKIRVRACGRERTLATTSEGGVFELKGGAYSQHRGTSQTPNFKSASQFRRWVRRNMFRTC